MKDHLFLAEYGLSASVPPKTGGEQRVLLWILRWGEVLYKHQGGLLLMAPLPGLGAAPLRILGCEESLILGDLEEQL